MFYIGLDFEKYRISLTDSVNMDKKNIKAYFYYIWYHNGKYRRDSKFYLLTVDMFSSHVLFRNVGYNLYSFLPDALANGVEEAAYLNV